MGQKQFTTYQADILSFDLREALLGILNSGRYSGYTTMASNGSPSGGNIPLILQHTNGVRKLPKGASALDASIGVMVTTQGTVIHEDQAIPILISNNAAGSSIKYALVYMEHNYTEISQGPNPAFYGVINGTAGAGIPALTNAFNRSVVGWVELASGATTIAGCKWHPNPSEDLFGDSKILKRLFGNNSGIDYTDGSVIPVDGVIGDRKYTEENYILDGESLTDSLDLMDMALQDLNAYIAEVKDRALDDVDWGLLTDNDINNATITHHGLLPKLPNDATKFLNGIGGWASFVGKRIKFKSVYSIDFDGASFENFANSTGNLQLMSRVNSDVEVVWLQISIFAHLPLEGSLYLAFKPANSDYPWVYTPQPSQMVGFETTIATIRAQIMVRIDPISKALTWSVGNPLAISTISIEIVAQETAL